MGGTFQGPAWFAARHSESAERQAMYSLFPQVPAVFFLAASISRNPKLLHSRLGVWDKKQCYFTAEVSNVGWGPVAATRGEHSGPGGHRSLLEAISFASLFTSLAVKRVAELPRPWLSPRIPTVPASKNNSQPVSLLNIGDVRLQKGQWTGASYSLQAAGIFISSDLET